MKYLLILVVFFSSCSHSPVMTSKDPFIVEGITVKNDYCKYMCTIKSGFWQSASQYIKADCGLYNIGDTIKLK